MFTSLISIADLVDEMLEPGWMVVDCRFSLGDPGAGRAAYAASHLPGAVYLDLEQDLSGPVGEGTGRHPLPDPYQLASTLGQLGIGTHTQVVVYDASGGMFAARVWWLLRWLGHTRVAVLDGGWQAWGECSLPLTQTTPMRPKQIFPVLLAEAPVQTAEVLTMLHDPQALLVDGRAVERYRGEVEPIDPVAGHIPGAVNRPFGINLQANGRFKRPEQLASEWSALLDGQVPENVIHYCGSGVSACHNVLAMEVAGLTGSRLYAGSWSAWCADPSRPITSGEL